MDKLLTKDKLMISYFKHHHKVILIMTIIIIMITIIIMIIIDLNKKQALNADLKKYNKLVLLEN